MFTFGEKNLDEKVQEALLKRLKKYTNIEGIKFANFDKPVVVNGKTYDENAMESYCDDLEHFGVDHKAYFSSRLKQIIAEKDAMDKLSDKDKTLTK